MCRFVKLQETKRLDFLLNSNEFHVFIINFFKLVRARACVLFNDEYHCNNSAEISRKASV